jgi:C4-dicarboxylate-specific signal transduction histidine kinase
MGALNYVQYVRPRLVDQRLDTWLGKAERDITRAADVVHNLLAFGKKGDEKRRPVALASVVAEVIEFAGPALRRADAEVKNRVAADLPLVSAQPKLLRQVLLNLLINAADAVADSPQRTVEIAAQGHGDQVDLSVEDAGPGVPEALRERIFEPFFSTKSQERGSGLGLAIARRLIEGSGGTLAYCPGARGARFVVGLRVVTDGDTDLAAPEIVAAKIRPASSAS